MNRGFKFDGSTGSDSRLCHSVLTAWGEADDPVNLCLTHGVFNFGEGIFCVSSTCSLTAEDKGTHGESNASWSIVKVTVSE